MAAHASDNTLLQQMLKRNSQQQNMPKVADTISLMREKSKVLYLTIKPASRHDNVNSVSGSLDSAADSNTPSVVVFINQSEMLGQTQESVMQQLFEFTRSEARLAIALANGMSLDEIAVDMFVSRNTVRSHLRSAFQKAGVSQQSALVSLVLRSMVGMG